MAKRKRKKSKTKTILFKSGSSKRKKKRKASYYPDLTRFIKVIAVACVVAGVGIALLYAVGGGFSFLDKYIKNTVPVLERTSTLKLIDVPEWVNDELEQKIYAAAAPNGDLKPNEESARIVQNNLARGAAWIDEVRVQTTHDSIQITGQWRRPLALVKIGLSKFYVDTNLIVLDYVPIPTLPIVRVEGLLLTPKIPPPGTVWLRDDLAAAVAILTRLNRMDELVTPDKPLLHEIDTIDVSNFKGRSNTRFPHIVLYAKDNTEIIWGAELDAWKIHLESTDKHKLAKLYDYYKRQGSLLGGVKYINLRDPQDNVPLPIDKF